VRDLAKLVTSGTFGELESWRTCGDPVKEAVYDLTMEIRKSDRGPAYRSAVAIFRRLQATARVTIEWDTYRIEEEMLEWEKLIKAQE
jgi:hypothetical protein